MKVLAEQGSLLLHKIKFHIHLDLSHGPKAQ
jgi:hypothetical protein